MRHFDAPVLLIQRIFSVIIFCNHFHVFRLYISRKQKIPVTVFFILKYNSDFTFKVAKLQLPKLQFLQKLLKF